MGSVTQVGLVSANNVQSFTTQQKTRARTNINASSPEDIIAALIDYTPTSGLASIALSGSASDLISGTVSDARLSSNVPLKNALNTFTASNTFRGPDGEELVINGSTITATDAQGAGSQMNINTNTSMMYFRTNGNNQALLLSGLNATFGGSILSGGAITTGYDVSNVGLYTSAIRNPINGSLSLDSPGAAGNLIIRVGPSYLESLRATVTGSLWLRSNVWHADGAGANRFYYEAGSTTYYQGHGSNAHVFRSAAGTDILTLTGALDTVLAGTLKFGANHLIRYNTSAQSVDIRDSTNADYRKLRSSEVQVVAATGGSSSVPVNSRIGFMTLAGSYSAGAISGRTYAANFPHGDIIISASPLITTGQNDYSNLTDDLVVRGNTGNVEINRGTLLVNSALAQIGATRPINFNGNNGFITIRASSGGWSTDLRFLGSSGTHLTGFGAKGTNDTLDHAYIGIFGSEIAQFAAGGLMGLGMASQSGRSFSILPQNTADRTGVRIYDYGAFTSASNQSGFEVAYLGGTFGAPSTTVAGHYRNLLTFRSGGSAATLASNPSFAIRSTIGSVIGSSLSEVNTSMLVTPTSTGVPLTVINMFGQTGLVDFPVGQVQLGTNVRLKNNSGDIQVRNSGDTDFAGIAASTGNFSNVVSASNGIKVSGTAGVQFSSATPVPGSGSIPWITYTANSNILYDRDTVNSRMHVTYTGGANAGTALTQFHSGVTVDGRLVASSGQTGNTLQATFTNTTANEPAGFRLNNGSWDIGFRTNPNNGWFEITGSTGDIQHRWHGVHYLLASAARIYFSSSGATITGSGIANQDLGIGRVSAGTLRIYNSAGNDGSLQALNGNFSGTVTSAFQTLSADPSTLDIATGLARLVKNSTSGEIAKWLNDGGVIKKITNSPPWSSITSKPTTLAGYGITDAVSNTDTRVTQGAICFRIDEGSSAIAVGSKKLNFRVPYNCTITSWELVADQSGSIVIDLWKDTYANFPPVDADSITASAKPTLSSAIKANSTTLTGWTTTLNAGDYIELEVESASTLTVVVLTLTVTKT